MKFWFIIIKEHLKNSFSWKRMKPERFFAVCYRLKEAQWNERWEFVNEARLRK